MKIKEEDNNQQTKPKSKKAKTEDTVVVADETNNTTTTTTNVKGTVSTLDTRSSSSLSIDIPLHILFATPGSSTTTTTGSTLSASTGKEYYNNCEQLIELQTKILKSFSGTNSTGSNTLSSSSAKSNDIRMSSLYPNKSSSATYFGTMSDTEDQILAYTDVLLNGAQEEIRTLLALLIGKEAMIDLLDRSSIGNTQNNFIPSVFPPLIITDPGNLKTLMKNIEHKFQLPNGTVPSPHTTSLPGSLLTQLVPGWILTLSAICLRLQNTSLTFNDELVLLILHKLVYPSIILSHYLPFLSRYDEELMRSSFIMDSSNGDWNGTNTLPSLPSTIQYEDTNTNSLSFLEMFHGIDVSLLISPTGGSNEITNSSSKEAVVTSLFNYVNTATCQRGLPSHPLLRTIYTGIGTVAMLSAYSLQYISTDTSTSSSNMIASFTSSSLMDRTLGGWLRHPAFGGDIFTVTKSATSYHPLYQQLVAIGQEYSETIVDTVRNDPTNPSVASMASTDPSFTTNVNITNASTSLSLSSVAPVLDNNSTSQAFIQSLFSIKDIDNISNLPNGVPTTRGTVLRSWLQSKNPLNRAQARKRQFVDLEVFALAAYIRHANPFILSQYTKGFDTNGIRSNVNGNGGDPGEPSSDTESPYAMQLTSTGNTHHRNSAGTNRILYVPLWIEVDTILRNLEASGPAEGIENRFSRYNVPIPLQVIWNKVLDLRRWLQDRYDAWRDADPQVITAVQTAITNSTKSSLVSRIAEPSPAASTDTNNLSFSLFEPWKNTILSNPGSVTGTTMYIAKPLSSTTDTNTNTGSSNTSSSSSSSNSNSNIGGSSSSSNSNSKDNDDDMGRTTEIVIPVQHPTFSALNGLVPGAYLDLPKAIDTNSTPSGTLMDALSRLISNRLTYLALLPPLHPSSSASLNIQDDRYQVAHALANVTLEDLVAMSKYSAQVHKRLYTTLQMDTIPGLHPERSVGKWLFETLTTAANAASGKFSNAADAAKAAALQEMNSSTATSNANPLSTENIITSLETDYTPGSFNLSLQAVTLFAREGWSVPINLLTHVRLQRAKRIYKKLFGLRALALLSTYGSIGSLAFCTRETVTALGDGLGGKYPSANTTGILSRPSLSVPSSFAITNEQCIDGGGIALHYSLASGLRNLLALIAGRCTKQIYSLTNSVSSSSSSSAAIIANNLLFLQLRTLAVDIPTSVDLYTIFVESGLLSALQLPLSLTNRSSIQEKEQIQTAMYALAGYNGSGLPFNQTGIINSNMIHYGITTGTLSMVDIVLYMYAGSVNLLQHSTVVTNENRHHQNNPSVLLNSLIQEVTGLPCHIHVPDIDETTDPVNDSVSNNGSNSNTNAFTLGTLNNPVSSSLGIEETMGLTLDPVLKLDAKGNDVRMQDGDESKHQEDNVSFDDDEDDDISTSFTTILPYEAPNYLSQRRYYEDEPNCEPAPLLVVPSQNGHSPSETMDESDTGPGRNQTGNASVVSLSSTDSTNVNDNPLYKRAKGLLQSVRRVTTHLSSAQIVAVYTLFMTKVYEQSSSSRISSLSKRYTNRETVAQASTVLLPSGILTVLPEGSFNKHHLCPGGSPTDYRNDFVSLENKKGLELTDVGDEDDDVTGGDDEEDGEVFVTDEVEGTGSTATPVVNNTTSFLHGDVLQSSIMNQITQDANTNHQMHPLEIGRVLYQVSGSSARVLLPVLSTFYEYVTSNVILNTSLVTNTKAGGTMTSNSLAIPTNNRNDAKTSLLSALTYTIIDRLRATFTAYVKVQQQRSGTGGTLSESPPASTVGKPDQNKPLTTVLPSASSSRYPLDAQQYLVELVTELQSILSLLPIPPVSLVHSITSTPLSPHKPTSVFAAGTVASSALLQAFIPSVDPTSSTNTLTNTEGLSILFAILFSSYATIPIKSAVLNILQRIFPYVPCSVTPAMVTSLLPNKGWINSSVSFITLLLDLLTAVHVPTVGGSRGIDQHRMRSIVKEYLHTKLSASDVCGTNEWGAGTGATLLAFGSLLTSFIRYLQSISILWSTEIANSVLKILQESVQLTENEGYVRIPSSPSVGPTTMTTGSSPLSSPVKNTLLSPVESPTTGIMDKRKDTEGPHTVNQSLIVYARGIAALHVLSFGWETVRPGSIVHIDPAYIAAANTVHHHRTTSMIHTNKKLGFGKLFSKMDKSAARTKRNVFVPLSTLSPSSTTGTVLSVNYITNRATVLIGTLSLVSLVNQWTVAEINAYSSLTPMPSSSSSSSSTSSSSFGSNVATLLTSYEYIHFLASLTSYSPFTNSLLALQSCTLQVPLHTIIDNEEIQVPMAVSVPANPVTLRLFTALASLPSLDPRYFLGNKSLAFGANVTVDLVNNAKNNQPQQRRLDDMDDEDTMGPSHSRTVRRNSSTNRSNVNGNRTKDRGLSTIRSEAASNASVAVAACVTVADMLRCTIKMYANATLLTLCGPVGLHAPHQEQYLWSVYRSQRSTLNHNSVDTTKDVITGRNPYLDCFVLIGGLHTVMTTALSSLCAPGFPSVSSLYNQGHNAITTLLDLSIGGKSMVTNPRSKGKAITECGERIILSRSVHSNGNRPPGLTVVRKVPLVGSSTMVASIGVKTNVKKSRTNGSPSTSGTPSSATQRSKLPPPPGILPPQFDLRNIPLPPAPPPPKDNGPPPPEKCDLNHWEAAKEMEAALGNSCSRYWCYKAVQDFRGDANNALMWLFDHPEPSGYGARELAKAQAFLNASRPAALSFSVPPPPNFPPPPLTSSTNPSSNTVPITNTAYTYGPVITIDTDDENEEVTMDDVLDNDGDYNDGNMNWDNGFDDNDTNISPVSRTNTNTNTRVVSPKVNGTITSNEKGKRTATTNTDAMDTEDNDNNQQIIVGDAFDNEDEDAPMVVRFDECIIEGIAFMEPLIIDAPPRLPLGYTPVSKAQLLSLGQQGRALLNSVGAAGLGNTATTNKASGNAKPSATTAGGTTGGNEGGNVKKGPANRLALGPRGTLRAARVTTQASRYAHVFAGVMGQQPSWSILQGLLQSSGLQYDENLLSASGATMSTTGAAGGGGKSTTTVTKPALTMADLMALNPSKGDKETKVKKTSSSAVKNVPVANTGPVYLQAYQGKSVLEYLNMCGLSYTGNRMVSLYSRSSHPLSNFPVPLQRIGVDGPLDMDSPMLTTAVPRTPVSAFPRGTLVWIAARRSDESILANIQVAMKATSTHEMLTETCIAALTAARTHIMQLSIAGTSAGVLATIVRTYQATLPLREAIDMNSGYSINRYVRKQQYAMNSRNTLTRQQQEQFDTMISYNHRLSRRQQAQMVTEVSSVHPFQRIISMTTIRIANSGTSTGLESSMAVPIYIDIPSDWVHIVTHVHGACIVDEPVVPLNGWNTSAVTTDNNTSNAAASLISSSTSTGAAALQALVAASASSLAVYLARGVLVSLLLSWPSHLPFTLSNLSILQNNSNPSQALRSTIGRKPYTANNVSSGAKSLISLLKLVAANEGVLYSSGSIIMLSERGHTGVNNTSGDGGNVNGVYSQSALGQRDIHTFMRLGRFATSVSDGHLVASGSSSGSAIGTITTALRSQIAAIIVAETAGVPFVGISSSEAGNPTTKALLDRSTDTKMDDTGTSGYANRRVWLCGACDNVCDSFDCSASASTLLCSACRTAATPVPLVNVTYDIPNSSMRTLTGSSVTMSSTTVAPSTAKSSLSSALVKDCLVSLINAGDACAQAASRSATKQSTHPVSSMRFPFESGTVHVEGATALWITFDPRCSTDPSDESSYFEIFASQSLGYGGASAIGSKKGSNNKASSSSSSSSAASSSVSPTNNGMVHHLNVAEVGSHASPSELSTKGICIAHMSGPSHMFKPIMVAADTIHWVIAKGKAIAGQNNRQSLVDGGWGVQFNVTPLTGIVWEGDVAVPRKPSLLWGTWLLDFLITNGLDHISLSKGILHNGRILSTLVDYLRTSGAPYKEKAIALLHRLLSSPDYLLITPRHIDYKVWGTEEAVRTIVDKGVPSCFHPNDAMQEAEKALLQRITAVPIDTMNNIRSLAIDLKARAESANVMFLPRPLQRILELVATAESAIKRARIQMHILYASAGGLYRDLSGTKALRALFEPITLAINDEGRTLLATAGRSDAVVPMFDGFSIAYSPSVVAPRVSAHARWAPPLVLVKPALINTLSEIEALSHLRDVLVALLTGRRLPDAWMLRAVILATRADPNDLQGITPEVVADAHYQNAAFTIHEDEAVIAWMGSYAARKNLGGALEIQPSKMEFNESDASSYPLLEKFRVRNSKTGADEVCAFGLRIRVSFFLILNTLLKRCISSIDVTPWTDEILSSSNNNRGGSGNAMVENNQDENAEGNDNTNIARTSSSSGYSYGGLSSDMSVPVQVAFMEQKRNRGKMDEEFTVTSSNNYSSSNVLGPTSPLKLPIVPKPASTIANVTDVASSLHSLHVQTVGALLRRIPHWILVDAKESLIQKAIEATETPGTSGIKVLLDNRTAMASTEHCILDPMASLCTFAQLVRHMVEAKISAKQLRCRLSDRETLFEVGYVSLTGSNEEGLDWGGVYRETIARCVEDLFGDNRGIDLFVLSPNALAARNGDNGPTGMGGGPVLASVGDGSFIPNPRYCPANVVGSTAVAGAATATTTPKVGGSATLPTTAANSTNALLTRSSQGSITPATLSLVSTMYVWVGRLMAISIRTRSSDLEVDLSSVVWKLLVGEPLNISDIASLDSRLGVFLQRIADWSYDQHHTTNGNEEESKQENGSTNIGGSSSSLSSSSSSTSGSSSSSSSASSSTVARMHAEESAFLKEFGHLFFVLPESVLTGYVSTEGSNVSGISRTGSSSSAAAVVTTPSAIVRQHFNSPLLLGGATTMVTPSNRMRYISLVIQAAVSSYTHAIGCIRSGMASVIPDRAISLCGWRDLLRLVCGDSAIDIENLYRNTKYDSNRYYHENHPVVLNFWKAMRELSPEQKRNFVRYAWGRSRLPRGKWPIQANGNPVKFTIVPQRGHTKGIPLSHTCFFLIELPEYPDFASLKRNLLLAITYGAGEAFLIA